jgi:uncharacterized protein
VFYNDAKIKEERENAPDMPTIEQAREWYLKADPVHDFDHVLRVYRMAERLARAEGADLEIVQAAVLLHDAEGSAPGSETRKNHHHRSADFAGLVLVAEGWPADRISAVQHCIRAHRFRNDGETPQTLEARILFDADKLDVLGAIGAARTITYAALNNQPFYAPPSKQFIESGEKEPGEPHSAYHEYVFKLCRIKDLLFTSTARALASERDIYLEDFFRQLASEIAGEK